MVPRIFLKNATVEDRRFLRKWTYAVAIVYGVFGLAIVAAGFMTAGGNNGFEASNTPAHNQISSIPDAGR
jgi:hypothetical protein